MADTAAGPQAANALAGVDLLKIKFSHDGHVFDGMLTGDVITQGSKKYIIGEVTLLAPSRPSKIVCVGLNYTEHARELKMELPSEPILFLKPPSAVINPGDKIIMPKMSSRVDYEGELGVVIGKRCRNVKSGDAQDCILGYTCFNDVTARDLQRKDGQWTRAKSFDTFAPFGPGIAMIDPGSAKIQTRVNGNVRQSSNTSDLIFDVFELVEFISQVMTLEEGDVIATGTPPGVGQLQSGDVAEVEIEGVGVLRNPVAR